YGSSIDRYLRVEPHLGRIQGSYIQSISNTTGNILVSVVDKFKLELTGHPFPFYNRPTDKTFLLTAIIGIGKHITARTVVIPKKPITAFKTIGYGIIEQYRIKLALVP